VITKKISYHFDITSPFSYLGFKQLLAFQTLPQWPSDLQVEFVPILLSGIIKVRAIQTEIFNACKVSGNIPPATNPLKGSWLGRDLKLSFAVHGIPINIMPKKFPIQTLTCMRLLTVIKATRPSLLVSAIDALFVLIYSYETS
jgi:2-hydroxychromene-2-carboxylate isomerase